MTAEPREPYARRRALSGPSARSLLMTVLGNNVLPGDGTVWTGTVVDALAMLGVEEKTARQALARTAADGWLQSERHGRRVRWSFSDAGRELFERGRDRIFSFRLATPRWDGSWLLLFTSVPEARRKVRHRLRTRLAWAGFGLLGQGVWVTPEPAREAEAKEVLGQLDLLGSASSFVARYGTIGEQHALVTQAWDIAELAARYDAFIDDVTGQRPRSDADAFVAHTHLVHQWRRFPFLDPGLPPGLLPTGWSGARGGELFHARHAAWSARSQRWFDGREAVHRRD